MTDSTKTTEQSQQSQTSPWAPAQGLLTNLISQYGAQNPGVTAGQSGALSNLVSSTSNLPNFGNAGAGAIGNLFNSDNSGQVGMLNNAYGTLTNNLGATASGANLNPYDTPGFGDAIKTAISDATNATKSVYAGSGRDPSGAGSFAQSLGRGITQGISPTIANQYNQNYGNMLNANNSIFGAAGSTASGINNLNQQRLSNGIAGISAAGALPGLYSSPALAQLGAANAQYSQPFQNLAQLLQPSIGLAGLGAQSSGSGNSTVTSNPSLLSSIQQGFQAGGTGLSALGSAGSLASGLGSSIWSALGPAAGFLSFSDARLKTDITPVGKLNDGQTVHSFKYKGSDTPQIGLLAQEVMQHEPDAVAVHPSGALMVDYGKATHKARSMAHGKVGALRRAA